MKIYPFSLTFSLFSVITTKHHYSDLSDEQQQDVHEILTQQIHKYTKYRKVGTHEPQETSPAAGQYIGRLFQRTAPEKLFFLTFFWGRGIASFLCLLISN